MPNLLLRLMSTTLRGLPKRPPLVHRGGTERQRPGKRPVSSRGTSSHDGSRSTKSQKIGEALRDAATNIGKLSQIKIEEITRHNEWCVAKLKVWDKSYPKHEPVEIWSQKRLTCMHQFEKIKRWCHIFLQSDESF